LFLWGGLSFWRFFVNANMQALNYLLINSFWVEAFSQSLYICAAKCSKITSVLPFSVKSWSASHAGLWIRSYHLFKVIVVFTELYMETFH
jgi:hypothetical protein